jgi:hypothetical protein
MMQGLVGRVLLVGALSVGVLAVGAVGPAVASTPSPTSVTTLLSDGTNTGTALTESLNTPVTDSVTLSGADASSAGGTVTYVVFSSSKCTKVVDDNQVTVTNGVVPSSAPVTLSKAGAYYWTAVYSGDANNASSVEGCGSEVETVAGGTIVNTATDSATCQSSGTLTFDPPLVSGGTAPEKATLAMKLKDCTASGSTAVTINSATWQGTMTSSADACTALSAALPSLSSALTFKTTPSMRSGASNIVFNNVTDSGSTLADSGAAANAASGTAPFQGSDQSTSSGFSLTTSVTTTQAAATCAKKAKGLKSIKVTKGTLTLQ